MSSLQQPPHLPYKPSAYQPALDGLRGISIAAVLLYHDDYLIVGGYLGVDIFFVLSGFLITSLLLDEWRRESRIDLRRFYLRRALRLFPALAVLLTVGTIFALLFPNASQSRHILRGVGYSVVYMTNWANARDPFSLGPLGHTWSLAVEEQFYLLWPLILIALLKVVRGKRALIAYTFGLAIVSASWRFCLSLNGSTPWRLYNGTDTRADSLLMGCVAAMAMVLTRFPELVGAKLRTRLLAIAGAALIGCLMKGTPLEWIGYDRGMFLAVGIAAAIIIVAVISNPTWIVTRVLSASVLVGMGRLSYSLYLWHLPIYGLIKPGRFSIGTTSARIVRVLAAFVAALLSYCFVERPFLRLKTRLSKKQMNERRTLTPPEASFPPAVDS